MRAQLGFEYDEYDGIQEISIEYAESTMKHLNFFEALIEHICDGGRAYHRYYLLK